MAHLSLQNVRQGFLPADEFRHNSLWLAEIFLFQEIVELKSEPKTPLTTAGHGGS
jgi:hypothetical protein